MDKGREKKKYSGTVLGCTREGVPLLDEWGSYSSFLWYIY